ncbi:hypothetical protein OAP43_02170 [Candidatus Pseudothioglobus singularis]|nr:hypothetical protein [Candidatus Pseudothioglobus singularis]
MKRLLLLFCITSLSVSASQEQMMSIINKKAEMTAEEYLAEILQGTICKWDITEEERLFIENY